MKLVFFLASCLMLASCQKELSYEVDPGTTGGSGGGSGSSGGNSNGTYYIKGKKDGTAFNFATYPMVTIIGVSGNSMVSFNANATSPTTSMEGIALSISFSNGASLSTGTYSEDDNSMDHIVAGVYNPNSATIVYGAGQYYPSALPLKITVLTKTTSEITGTFQGAFYKTDTGGGTITAEHYTITEGEFKLPIK